MFTTPLTIHLALIFRNDPTPDRGCQLPRAASLLSFIHDLRAGLLEPDVVRGTPLDMDHYSSLFGTSRIPTDVRLEPLSLLVYLATRCELIIIDQYIVTYTSFLSQSRLVL